MQGLFLCLALYGKLEVIEEHPLIATSYYGYFLQLHQ